MKAYVVDKYKRKGALRLAELPPPQVENADVLVRVHATAVNPLDSKIRDGAFGVPTGVAPLKMSSTILSSSC